MPAVAMTSRVRRLFGLETGSGVGLRQYVVPSDLVVRVVLGMLFWGLYAFLGFAMASTRAFGRDDVYIHLFDADVYPFIKGVSDVGSPYPRTETHPLFPLFFRPTGILLARALGSDVSGAVFLTSFAGGVCVAMAHGFLRLAGLPGLSALVWTVILGLSFAYLIFDSMPDTFIFSAASVITLFVLAVRYPGSLRHFVPASILASGILVTNFVQSAIVFFVSLGQDPPLGKRLRRLARFVALVGVSVLLLGWAQSFVYPRTFHRFLSLAGEHRWMFVPSSLDAGFRRFTDLTRHMFIYSIVSPKLGLVGPERPRHRSEMPILSMQRRHLWFHPIGALASGLWTGLMVTGGLGLVRSGAYRTPEVVALATSILFNLGLHYFYGWEMFLYSANWAFLIVGLVALGVARGYARDGRVARLCTAGAIALAVSEAVNNGYVVLDLVRAFEAFRQLNP